MHGFSYAQLLVVGQNSWLCILHLKINQREQTVFMSPKEALSLFYL